MQKLLLLLLGFLLLCLLRHSVLFRFEGKTPHEQPEGSPATISGDSRKESLSVMQMPAPPLGFLQRTLSLRSHFEALGPIASSKCVDRSIRFRHKAACFR